MRPIDLAREHGLSTQAVRNYEQAGILPAAGRTPSGYRTYTERHAQALRTFLALVPGHGHAATRAIMTTLHEGRVEGALEQIDLGHAELLERRRVLDGVQRALAGLTDVHVTRRSAVPIGALAHQLGVRPATLRRWERSRLLRPARDRAGHRTYGGVDVRDAHVVRELRRGGYPLVRIGPLLDELRLVGDTGALTAALTERRNALTVRARAMLRGAGMLDAYLGSEGHHTISGTAYCPGVDGP